MFSADLLSLRAKVMLFAGDGQGRRGAVLPGAQPFLPDAGLPGAQFVFWSCLLGSRRSCRASVQVWQLFCPALLPPFPPPPGISLQYTFCTLNSLSAPASWRTHRPEALKMEGGRGEKGSQASRGDSKGPPIATSLVLLLRASPKSAQAPHRDQLWE